MDQSTEQFLLILAVVLRHVPDRGLAELCQRFDHLGEEHACVAALREEAADRAAIRVCDG
jgi:hypothetical protein